MADPASPLRVPNEDRWRRLVEELASSPLEDRCVVADWDRTLTRAADDQGRDHSIYSVLVQLGSLGPGFARETLALYDRYRPVELDPNLDEDEKSALMDTWWAAASDLLVKHGFGRSTIEELSGKNGIELREGVPDFLSCLSRAGVPVYILSAGIGEVIEAVLESRGLRTTNVQVVSNAFHFEEGIAVGVKPPVIHTMNKLACFREWLAERHLELPGHALVIGDSVEDLCVLDGAVESRLKVGWLHASTPALEAAFDRTADAYVVDDAPFSVVPPLAPRFWEATHPETIAS